MQSLQINIHALGLPFDGDTVATKSLGGSESAAYYIARELVRRGHRVHVWTTAEKDSTTDGVKYLSVGECNAQTPLGHKFEHYARNTPHDVLIIQRGALSFHKKFAAKVCIWQLHDLALHRQTAQILAGTWQIDAVTCVSEWHREQVLKVWGLNPDGVHVVHNGVDPALYPSSRIDAATILFDAAASRAHISGNVITLPTGKQLWLFQSRPERGLENLVRPGGIMDQCRDLNAELLVVGYENTVPQMADYYAKLRAMGDALPNVTHLGALTKAQLAELQQCCTLMVYPTEFQEVSCITAMEAMHAGLPMISTHCGALPETCAENDGTSLVYLKDGKLKLDKFVERLRALATAPTMIERMRRAQVLRAKSFTWERVGDELEALIAKLFAGHTRAAIVRHAIEHGDIDFARHVDPDNEELRRMYAFTCSNAAYTAHYREQQTVYYRENKPADKEHETISHTTRFRGVLHLLSAAHNDARDASLRVLDYGCAHGHYLRPLAAAFPQSQFVGVDIGLEAIELAEKGIESDGLKNAIAIYDANGMGSALDDEADFDVILACEVLEHVRDQDTFLQSLKARLAPGGSIIFTTPNGRWEWSSVEKFRTYREHLRLYERADISDLCGDDKHEILHAPASQDQSGLALGSFVWRVQPGADFGTRKIDYDRKLAYYAPRQTISACLIVKDGEQTLRKCLESFIDYVDEVIVCIDPATSDRTLSICEQIEADYPLKKIIAGIATSSALRDGFDVARNESLAKATGDWILWCDADEEVRHASRLHMLAKRSLHNGYGCAQLHYAVEPPEVITTDFPTRFFRNHIGAKFYGVVHEHPETVMGKAIEHSIVRPEIQFLHAGYIDEETRRRRFQRNYPLLVRDRAKYPARHLNKFLMVRDIAQSLMFEQQQAGGTILPGHRERAQEGIAVFEELCSGDGPAFSPRMIGDAMQYYSHCVVTSGGGFDATLTVATAIEVAPTLAQSVNIKGRFHTRKFFNQLAQRLTEESTKVYENEYL